MPAWLGLLSSLSAPVWIILALFGMGGTTAIITKLFGPRAAIIFAVGVVVVGALVAAYVIILRALDGRRSGKFQKELQSQGAATPAGVNRAEQIAKLDDLRRKYEEGVQKFRVAGKNLASVPWYMVIGEPGSGKSEAIRRCGVGFPPGLQDELQGVGGTVNMNWWFTHQAVILDIAGRLVFGEVESTGTGEWTEFLRMLHRSRPACPINGMLLVIPATSLIEDAPDVLKQKAARLARQLDTVQRTLDIRFPVYIVVTKGDLINGFREMFDDLDSAQLQHQIFGWTNPDPIDAPFPADRTAQLLDGLRGRLMQRRLELLSASASERGPGGEPRLDRIDTLFDLPASFAALYDPLRTYFQELFTVSQWSPKPLFVRGIYVTSSMREGAALDMNIARALQIRPEDLPEGKLWEKDRAFFLRDLFLTKVFREWGLVTRATNVHRQQRTRWAITMGCAAAAMALLIGASLYSGLRYRKLVGEELQMWTLVGTRLDSATGPLDCSLSMVQADSQGNLDFRGAEDIPNANIQGLRGSSPLDLHDKLADRVLREKSLRVPWIFRLFRPLVGNLQDKRDSAFRVFYDFAVVRSAVDGAREWLAQGRTPWDENQALALVQLLEIEADRKELNFPARESWEGPLDLRALLALYPSSPSPVPQSLQDALVILYEDRAVAWPPAWLPAGVGIARYPAVNLGVDRMLDQAVSRSGVSNILDQVRRISSLQERLRTGLAARQKTAADRQADLLKWLGEKGPQLALLPDYPRLLPEFNSRRQDSRDALQALETEAAGLMTEFQTIPLLSAGSLDQEYDRIVRDAAATFSKHLPQDLRYATNAYPPKTILYEVADKVENKRQSVLRFQDTNLVLQVAKQFSTEYAAVSNQVAGLRAFVALGLPEFPRRLVEAPPQAWSEDVKHALANEDDLQNLQESTLKFGKGVRDAVVDYQRWLTNDPGSQRLLECATNTVRLLESARFAEQVARVQRSWLSLDYGSALANRGRLLNRTPNDFKTSLLVPAPPGATYAEQYWNRFLIDALGVLVTQSLQEVAGKIESLAAFAKFPLDRSSKQDLTKDDLANAGLLLESLVSSPSNKPGTLAAGAELDDPRLDALIGPLRQLDLGPQREWISAAYAMTRALPPISRKEALEIGLRTLSIPDHNKRLKENSAGYGTGSKPWAWQKARLVSVNGPSPVFRSEQEAGIAKVTCPGPALRIQFRNDSEQRDLLKEVEFAAPWAVLRMLAGPQVVVAEGEKGQLWDVELPAGADDFFWLRVEMPPNMPKPEEWPVYPR